MSDTPHQDAPRVRFPPPLAFLGALLVGWALDRWGTGWILPLHGFPRWLLGGMVLTAGIAFVAPALLSFRRARENPEPWTPSKQLIVKGLYRYTRNPMYLGMSTAYLGLAILLQTITALIFLPFVMWLIQAKVIAREEAYLLRQFGDGYAAYTKAVRRWI